MALNLYHKIVNGFDCQSFNSPLVKDMYRCVGTNFDVNDMTSSHDNKAHATILKMGGPYSRGC